jgi:hypothetical protein
MKYGTSEWDFLAFFMDPSGQRLMIVPLRFTEMLRDSCWQHGLDQSVRTL